MASLPDHPMLLVVVGPEEDQFTTVSYLHSALTPRQQRLLPGATLHCVGLPEGENWDGAGFQQAKEFAMDEINWRNLRHTAIDRLGLRSAVSQLVFSAAGQVGVVVAWAPGLSEESVPVSILWPAARSLEGLEGWVRRRLRPGQGQVLVLRLARTHQDTQPDILMGCLSPLQLNLTTTSTIQVTSCPKDKAFWEEMRVFREKGLREVGPRFATYFRGCLQDPQEPQDLEVLVEQVTTTVTVTVRRDAASTALVEEEADPFPVTLVVATCSPVSDLMRGVVGLVRAKSRREVLVLQLTKAAHLQVLPTATDYHTVEAAGITADTALVVAGVTPRWRDVRMAEKLGEEEQVLIGREGWEERWLQSKLEERMGDEVERHHHHHQQFHQASEGEVHRLSTRIRLKKASLARSKRKVKTMQEVKGEQLELEESEVVEEDVEEITRRIGEINQELVIKKDNFRKPANKKSKDRKVKKTEGASVRIDRKVDHDESISKADCGNEPNELADPKVESGAGDKGGEANYVETSRDDQNTVTEKEVFHQENKTSAEETMSVEEVYNSGKENEEPNLEKQRKEEEVSKTREAVLSNVREGRRARKNRKALDLKNEKKWEFKKHSEKENISKMEECSAKGEVKGKVKKDDAIEVGGEKKAVKCIQMN